MNSRNIVMLIGDLDIWLHEYLGGIRPDPEAPGFKRIIIKPEPVGDLAWAKESYDSVRGRINSEWHRSAGQFDLRVTIPANTTATVCLPAKDVKSITESGESLMKATGVESAKMEGDRAVLEIGSGSYHFVSDGNPM
jgi:alpha-L-rhamnosidase